MVQAKHFLSRSAFLFVAYAVAATLGLQAAAIGGAGSPVWPAAGVALAGLLLGGVRLWPAIVLARLAAGAITGSSHPPTVELAIAFGNALSAAVPAAILIRLGFDRRLAAMRDVLLLAVAAAASAASATAIGTVALGLSRSVARPPALETAVFWWFGAFVGAFLVAAAVLSWSDREGRPRGPAQIAHFVLLLAATALASSILFLSDPDPLRRVWLIYPLLIWVALAFHVAGAALALLVVAVAATVGAALGVGPFEELSVTMQGRILHAQQFAGATALVTLVLAAVADERRGARALAESEARMRAVLEQMPVGVALARVPSGELVFHNTRAVEILRHPLIPSTDVSGYAEYGALGPDGGPMAPEAYPIARAVLAGAVVDREPMRYRRGDGTTTDLEVSAAPILDRSRRQVLAVSTFDDVAERKRAQEALLASEERLRLARDAGGIVTWEWTPGSVGATLTGPVDRLLGLPPGDPSLSFDAFLRAVHPEDRPMLDARFADALAGLAAFDVEFRVIHPDGAVRWVVARGRVYRDGEGCAARMAGVAYDVTERRVATEALAALNAELEARVAEGAVRVAHLQKMESLGQLTGGMAHDFNNLLMAVLSALATLRKRLPHDEQALRLLDNAVAGAERGVGLTQRLLAFARKQVLAPAAVDVPTLVTGMLDLIRRSIGPQIRIETRFEEDVPPALVDANQLEVALVNLAVNARDAMPEGGVLTIAVAAARQDGARFVAIGVSDTGTGMDAHTLERAVEPFFTTKDVGQGTGLGLAMVHGLAEQSGGRFRLSSSLGEGTTAEIVLPVAEDRPASERAPAPAQAVPAAPKRLDVLVVDDDALVLMGTSGLLEDLGHTVVEAGSGAQALALLESGRPFDVLVTDQAMPGMNGFQLAQAAKALRPDLPVVLATGYARPGVGSGPAEAKAVDARLSKPFGQADLGRVLETVTAGRGR